MHAKQLLVYLAITIVYLAISPGATAQTRQPFTGHNLITIVLEGPTARYEFTSRDLLVRYNHNTEQLECTLQIASLDAVTDSIPPNMAYEVLYGAKFPDLVFMIELPKEVVNRNRTFTEPHNRRASVTLQGTTNRTRIPVQLLQDKNSLAFSTSFDLMLDNFQASVPEKYLPFLSGRILINISNARWIDRR